MSPCHGCLLSGPRPPYDCDRAEEREGCWIPLLTRLLEDFQEIEPLWCQEAKAYFVELTLNYPKDLGALCT